MQRLRAPAHWRVVDFIADLHLKPEEPQTVAAWRRYLLATPAQAVFMLGDVFEAWVGDDCAQAGGFEAECAHTLRAAAARAQVFFMHGNRDFLLGTAYLDACGAALLDDPAVLDCGAGDAAGRILLTHGDWLCTADAPYQQLRAQLRSPAWQAAFLARPLPERQAIARHMRQQSEASHQNGGQAWVDVDESLAAQWLHHARAHTLIHGHTHRAGEHALGRGRDGAPLQRKVLSDWHIDAQTRRLQVLRLHLGGGHPVFTRLEPDCLGA